MKRWKDGINPRISPERRDEILETRAAREARIEAWYKEHPEAERFDEAEVSDEEKKG